MPDISSPWRIMEIREEIEEAIKEIHSDTNLETGLYVDPKYREKIETRFHYDYVYSIQKITGTNLFLKRLKKI